ncbi:MAG: class I SAM-dependent methyltransferase [Candidatus Zixiibacteriota bacterium]|nr:MAG: class I SAM-dependent methyltransferase [candidate division Zixibacteria bacterium]
MSNQSEGRLAASFRDPSGFIFRRDGILYRQINRAYQAEYDLLMSSGLYKELVDANLMVPHDEVEEAPAQPDTSYRVIQPRPVPFISYPYEWCFSQLKNAALIILDIQKRAMAHDMVLKDASAYNIQFMSGKPILIDTLSFARYFEGRPWVAYRQFCKHFLAPLALMCYRDVRLGQLSRIYIDGVPLDLAGILLPWRTRMSLSLLTHIHLHARSQKHFASKQVTPSAGTMRRQALLGLIDNLESCVGKLNWQPGGTVWADYYDQTNYDEDSLEHKKRLAAAFLERTSAASVWDLGANIGLFSRIAAAGGAFTVAFDFDPAAVEKNYRECVRAKETRILPLVLDLTNPSPGIGWEHRERLSLLERAPADAVLALALIHHLAIGNNVSFDRVAQFFGKIGRTLIIEFIPKDDSQVKRMLASREDIFPEYTRDEFEKAFSRIFTIEQTAAIENSKRILYLMKHR